MRSNEVSDKEVISSQGTKIGVVKDVVFDEKEWKILAFDVDLEKSVSEEFNVKHHFSKTRVPIRVSDVQAVGDKIVLRTSGDIFKLVETSR
ncbi:MAG: PRC-barrel domain-containing protein [Nitrososphaerales archaeon]